MCRFEEHWILVTGYLHGAWCIRADEVNDAVAEAEKRLRRGDTSWVESRPQPFVSDLKAGDPTLCDDPACQTRLI